MPFFGSHSRATHGHTTTIPHRRGFFHHRDRDRVAGGYSMCPILFFCPVVLIFLLEAALSNPNTTHRGRQQAKHELRAMVCFLVIGVAHPLQVLTFAL